MHSVELPATSPCPSAGELTWIMSLLPGQVEGAGCFWGSRHLAGGGGCSQLCVCQISSSSCDTLQILGQQSLAQEKEEY